MKRSITSHLRHQTELITVDSLSHAGLKDACRDLPTADAAPDEIGLDAVVVNLAS